MAIAAAAGIGDGLVRLRRHRHLEARVAAAVTSVGGTDGNGSTGTTAAAAVAGIATTTTAAVAVAVAVRVDDRPRLHRRPLTNGPGANVLLLRNDTTVTIVTVARDPITAGGARVAAAAGLHADRAARGGAGLDPPMSTGTVASLRQQREEWTPRRQRRPRCLRLSWNRVRLWNKGP